MSKNACNMQALFLLLSILKLLSGSVDCVSPDENLAVLPTIANPSVTEGRQSFNGAESGQQSEASTRDFEPIRRNRGNSQSFANHDENADPVNPADIFSSSSSSTQYKTTHLNEGANFRYLTPQRSAAPPASPVSSVPPFNSPQPYLMVHQNAHYIEPRLAIVPVVRFEHVWVGIPRAATLVRPMFYPMTHQNGAGTSNLSPVAKSSESEFNFPSRNSESAIDSASSKSDPAGQIGISTGSCETDFPNLSTMLKDTRGHPNEEQSKIWLHSQDSQSPPVPEIKQDENSLHKLNSVLDKTDEKKKKIEKNSDDIVTLKSPQKGIVAPTQSHNKIENVDLNTGHEEPLPIRKIELKDGNILEAPKSVPKIKNKSKKNLEKTNDNVVTNKSPQKEFTPKDKKYDNSDQDLTSVSKINDENQAKKKNSVDNATKINSPKESLPPKTEQNLDSEGRKPVSKINVGKKKKLKGAKNNVPIINFPEKGFIQTGENIHQPENQSKISSQESSLQKFPKDQDKEILKKISEAIKSPLKTIKLGKDNVAKKNSPEEAFINKVESNHHSENKSQVSSQTSLVENSERIEELDKTIQEDPNSLAKINDQKEEITGKPESIEKLPSRGEVVQNFEANHNPGNAKTLNSDPHLSSNSVLNDFSTERLVNNKGKLKKDGGKSDQWESATGSEIDLESEKEVNIKGAVEAIEKRKRKKKKGRKKVITGSPARITDEMTEKEEKTNKVIPPQKNQGNVADVIKGIKNQLDSVIAKDKSMAAMPHLDQDLNIGLISPGSTSGYQQTKAENSKNEVLDRIKESKHMNENTSGPPPTEPKISSKLSSGSNKRVSMNQTKGKKTATQPTEIFQKESQEIGSTSISENVSKFNSKDKGIISDIPNDELKTNMSTSIKNLIEDVDNKRLELFGRIISQAFNPGLNVKGKEKYLISLKNKFRYAYYTCRKDFSRELGLKFDKMGNFKKVNSEILQSNFQKLLEKHLEFTNSQEYMLVPEMNFILFKKLQIFWYINHELFSQVASFFKIDKAEMFRRMQTLKNQIYQHTIVENWKIVKPDIIKEGIMSPLLADQYEQAYMLTTMFPFLTDFSRCSLKVLPPHLMQKEDPNTFFLLYQVIGIQAMTTRQGLRHRIELFWDRFPSLWKLQKLEDYYKHSDLELLDTLFAGEELGLSLDREIKTSLEFEGDAEFCLEVLTNTFFSKGQLSLVPWHESTIRHFFVETFGEDYDTALKTTLKELEKHQLGIDKILTNSKVKDEIQLQEVLEARPVDMLRFADMGLNLYTLIIIMSSRSKDKLGKMGQLNWDLLEDLLPIKMNEEQKAETESWFEANVE